ncbi:hypothetical protein [Desulforhopalus sp. IMCC35007]|uniref:hypothetical protein n=1 Tax=Desulforhopalus sp. IMCC35007 TaxID=2569543 RepID=UPI0010AEE1BD|nr:hypothetical protein [Desulforhopalus sp. IMCC35007]TKB08825.1 hypothetical protein FCL48_12405 [Desulforhopalus sp. IMCC35007]
MQNIINLFAKQYGLTRNEVMAEIENVFSTVLSRWYRLEVMVFFRDDLQLEAVAYNKVNGVTMQRLVDLAAIRGPNTLKKHLQKSLTRSAVLKQTRYYKSYEKQLCWGDIISHDSAQNIFVETEIIPGQIVTAFCPLNRIGLHERNTRCFSIGMRRAFHVRRIDPVVLGDTPRLKIVVDRVSKTLVETLLRNNLGPDAERINFRCVKRYVGHKSFVLTTRRLPKSAIKAVSQELKERVQVNFVKKI